MTKCVKCDEPAEYRYRHESLKDGGYFQYEYCSKCANETVLRGETAWEYDEEDGYWWCRECDLHWTMLADTPEENGMNYCPQCGRRIAEFKGWREE